MAPVRNSLSLLLVCPSVCALIMMLGFFLVRFHRSSFSFITFRLLDTTESAVDRLRHIRKASLCQPLVRIVPPNSFLSILRLRENVRLSMRCRSRYYRRVSPRIRRGVFKGGMRPPVHRLYTFFYQHYNF